MYSLEYQIRISYYHIVKLWALISASWQGQTGLPFPQVYSFRNRKTKKIWRRCKRIEFPYRLPNISVQRLLFNEWHFWCQLSYAYLMIWRAYVDYHTFLDNADLDIYVNIDQYIHILQTLENWYTLTADTDH